MIKDAIRTVASGRSLSRRQSFQVMNAMMKGDVTPAQFGALLLGLGIKGETVDEISGFAHAMRERATTVPVRRSGLVDTCGTGGDGLSTFNISTTAAFIAAGAGVAVAKHGNRSVSSDCGSADVLESLGVNLDLEADEVGRCIDELGIGFLYAPRLHPAMKHAVGPRRELGIRTVFNLLGPLTNPAGASAQVMGVFDSDRTEDLARVAGNLGIRHAWVVGGLEGLDEISIAGPTRISEYRKGMVRTFTLTPEDLGVSRSPLADIRGGDAQVNARILYGVLRGASGPYRDSALVNAAAAIRVGGQASTLADGMIKARQSVDSGCALRKLEQLVNYGGRKVSVS